MASLRLLAFLSSTAALVTPAIAAAQTNPDTGVTGVCVSNCGSSSSSSSSSDGGLVGALIREIFRDRSDERRSRAADLNNQAVELSNAEHWEKALPLLRRAFALNPNSPIIRRNLIEALGSIAWREVRRAQSTGDHSGLEQAEQMLNEADRLRIDGHLAEQIAHVKSQINDLRRWRLYDQNEERRHAEEQARIKRSLADASGKVSRVVDEISRDLADQGHPIAAGLGFGDPRPQPPNALAAPPSQQIVASDPMVVDSRGTGALPPGVPRLEEVENSPGKQAWLRGMDAVVQKDWQLALAWFQTALQRDPTNAALGRAVELAQWTWDRRQAAAVGGTQTQNRAEPPSLAQAQQAPSAAEVRNLEAALDEAFQREMAQSIAESRARQASRTSGGDETGAAEEERAAVEHAKQVFANEFGNQALQRIHQGDLAGALGLLEAAEQLAPHILNYRSTSEWLRTQLATKEDGTDSTAATPSSVPQN